MEIQKQLKDNRPNLSESSIKTYTSIIKNLYKRMFPHDEHMDLKKLEDESLVLDHLKDMDGSKRKTILSALVVLIKDNKDYRQLMINDATQYNDLQKKQEKTEQQKEHWITQQQVFDVYKVLESNAKLLMKKKTLTSKDFQDIQNYIILSLYVLICPRRLMDFTEMKLKNVNSQKDNYINKKEFVFNEFKTKSYYGQQKVEIPLGLLKILKLWIKLNPNDYLLVDTKHEKLTPVKLNQRLNKIFNGKVSVNLLRHAFLTDKYQNIPALENMIATATAMGNSLPQSLEYVKK